MTVAEAQTLCLKQGTPFYSYRLPGERESVFGAQLDGEVAPFRQVGEQGKGFILVPFAESEEVPAWFIRGDITFREVTTDIEIRTGLSGTMGLTDIKPGQEPDISWEEYENTDDSSSENYASADDSLSSSTLHYLFVDGKGNVLSREYTTAAPVSDCQPVVKDSKVVYYASNANTVNFYSIDANDGTASKKIYRTAGENATWDFANGVLTISVLKYW